MQAMRTLNKPLPLFMRLVAASMLLFATVSLVAFAGNGIDLNSTAVKGILQHGNGGTDSAFFGVAGPTAAHTYTFPDTNTTVLTTNAAVTVAQGGTGNATLTNHGVVLGQGASAVAVTSAGSTGNCFMSNGASADPSFQACPAAPSFAWSETPSGTPNGILTTFGLAHTPTNSSQQLYKNGQLMAIGASADYTISASTITFNSGSIPKTGDILAVNYTF